MHSLHGRFMRKIISILITTLFGLLSLISCNRQIVRSGQIDNSTLNEDYTVAEISLDSSCIQKVRSFIETKYNYQTNFVKCMETKKFKKAMFLANEVKSESGFTQLSEEGVLVGLTDNCEIDTVIFSRFSK